MYMCVCVEREKKKSFCFSSSCAIHCFWPFFLGVFERDDTFDHIPPPLPYFWVFLCTYPGKRCSSNGFENPQGLVKIHPMPYPDPKQSNKTAMASKAKTRAPS